VVAFQWLAVPIIFFLYILLSFFSKEPPPMLNDTDREMVDVTV
jgi:hypothetical protein